MGSWLIRLQNFQCVQILIHLTTWNGKSGRATKMPNVTKVVGKRRMEKLLMGCQLNVVTPFHYILVEQTNSVWFGSSLPTSNWEYHWVKQSSARSDHWRRIAEYINVPFRLRNSLRGKVGIKPCVWSRRARERNKRKGKMLSSLPRVSSRVCHAVSCAGEGRAQSTLLIWRSLFWSTVLLFLAIVLFFR